MEEEKKEVSFIGELSLPDKPHHDTVLNNIKMLSTYLNRDSHSNVIQITKYSIRELIRHNKKLRIRGEKK
jgi:hypothetical protein